ncbi:MAG: hypothetical protein GTO02_07265 [Candidatus Dadabacteria bacterium]|nr:hypothetical protein [Candidatus Dadabacteria bacterium]NIQ14194.1 hypothetical protein [Candidatus Dadabacteria bacterium]
MNQILDLIEKLKQSIESFLERKTISERDKRAIKIATIAIGIFFSFLILKSLLTSGGGDKQKVIVLRERLQQVKEMRSEYEYSKNLLKQLTASIKKEDEALISVVEKILVDSQIDKKSFSIKDTNVSSDGSEEIYNERTVQVDIKKITLQKAIDVLYSIQSRDSFLKVSNLKLKTKFGKENLLDMSFRLSTFEFKRVL